MLVSGLRHVISLPQRVIMLTDEPSSYQRSLIKRLSPITGISRAIIRRISVITNSGALLPVRCADR
jgi:hypothetical protein